jgi:hypothetical protein
MDDNFPKVFTSHALMKGFENGVDLSVMCLDKLIEAADKKAAEPGLELYGTHFMAYSMALKDAVGVIKQAADDVQKKHQEAA